MLSSTRNLLRPISVVATKLVASTKFNSTIIITNHLIKQNSLFNAYLTNNNNNNYRSFATTTSNQAIPEISATEAKQILNNKPTKGSNSAKYDLIVDVRESDEVAQGMVPNALHIPLGELVRDCNTERLKPQFSNKNILVYCKAGGRSRMAATVLNNNGYKATNMSGGFMEYSKA